MQLVDIGMGYCSLYKILYLIVPDFIIIIVVRLNLFNHLLALFRTKFACKLAIRYPVFRWEICKGSV